MFREIDEEIMAGLHNAYDDGLYTLGKLIYYQDGAEMADQLLAEKILPKEVFVQ